jgi:Tol biopolymer transport system component
MTHTMTLPCVSVKTRIYNTIRRHIDRLLLLTPLILAFLLAVAPAHGQVQERIDNNPAGVQPTSSSWSPSISDDGRYVAFYSHASYLVENDTNAKADIFVKDRKTGVTVRVSVASDGAQSDDISEEPSISGDGRFVAFQSKATTLVTDVAIPPNSSPYVHVYLHDLQERVTTLLSQGLPERDAGRGFSYHPRTSYNGRYIVFSSWVVHRFDGEPYWKYDIFLYDRQSNTISLVSKSEAGVQGNGSDDYPDISGDGRYVLFQSDSTNLVSPSFGGKVQLIRHDRNTGENRLVSVSASGEAANSDARLGKISDDGRLIVFASYATNLTDGGNNDKQHVFMKDMTTGEVRRLTESDSGEPGNLNSFRPQISPDGGFVVFQSAAGNLVQQPANSKSQVYLYDVQKETLALVDRSPSGVMADRGSFIYQDVSEGGRYVVFDSYAHNLVPKLPNYDALYNSPNIYLAAGSASTDWSIGPKGLIGGWRNDLVVAGNIAAVAEGKGVTLYDISGDKPRKLSVLPLPVEPTAIAVSGTKLYGASGPWEDNPLFFIADISDTSAPALLGSCAASSPNSGRIIISGAYAYLSAELPGGWNPEAIGVVDVSNPAAPVARGNLPLGDGVIANAFAIDGARLYIQGSQSGAPMFFVYTFSGPLAPAKTGELAVGTGERSNALHALGNWVYSAVGTVGVRVVNVAAPASPAPTALITLTEGDQKYPASDVYAAGDLLYAAGQNGGLFAFNVTNPASPVHLGGVPMSGAFRVKGSTGGVAALSSEGDAALQKIGFSGSAPVSLGSASSPMMANGVLAADNRLYLGADGLFIYNATNPASPEVLSTDSRWKYFVPLAATPAQLVGLSAPADGWEKKIFSIINVSDPADPQPLGSYTAAGAFNTGIVSGSRAFLLRSTAGAGAEIVDFSNPTAPEKIGTLPFAGTSQHAVAASGNLACIAGQIDGAFRIHLFDVASPQTPVFKSDLATEGDQIRLWMSGTTLLASSNSGASSIIEVFNLTDPATPKRIATLRTEKAANDINVLMQDGQDAIILLAKPGGSVHTYGYNPSSGLLYAGPVCPSPYSHQVTVSQSPNSAGGYTVVTSDQSYGTYVQEITRGPVSCCLETQVLPAQAAAEGCTAAPTKVDPVECGGSVEVTAKAEDPWVFKEWTGAATGTSPTAQATAVASCSVAVANFWKPTLTLGTGNLNPSYVTEFYGLAGGFDYANGRTNVIANHLTLTANEVDDWLVKGLTFHTSGAGNEMEDIVEARLYLNSLGGALLGQGTFNADNGNIAFSFNVTVPKSSSVSMLLVYDYKPERAFPCNDYRTRIDMSDVNALPVNYPPGQKIPVPPLGAVQGAVSVKMGDIVIVDGNNQYGEPEDPARPLQNAPLEKPLKSRLMWQHPASVNWISYEITSPPANGGFLGTPPPGARRVEKIVPAEGYVEETMTLGARKGMQNPYWVQAGMSKKGASCYSSWAPPVFTAWGIGVELGTTSQYDNPNNGNDTFGTFLSNIQAENKFTLTITMAPPNYATVDHVLFSMGGYTREGIAVTPNQVYEAVFDMAAFQQPQTLLVTVVMLKDGARIEQTAEYRVKALHLPSWVDAVGRIAHPDSFTREFSGEDGGVYNFAFNYPTNFAWSDYVPGNVGLLGGLNNDLDIEFTANASYKVDETSTFGATVKGKPTILGQEFDLEGGLSGEFDPNFAFQRGTGALRASFAFDLPEKGFSKTFLIYGVPITAAVDLSGNVEIFIRGGAVLNRQLEFEEITVAPGTTVTGNVTISLSAVFGLAKIAATGSPTATVEIELKYTTASGTTTTWRGEIVVPITVVGSIFWGLGSAELYSTQLGPWTFPAGGASPQAFRPLALEPGAPSPRFLSASALASDGGGKRMIVWTDDADPEGASPNADLFFRYHNGTDWSGTAPLLAANEEWETDPAVVFTGLQGEQTTALACWTANKGAKTLADLDAILAAQDIACAFWNGAAWGAPAKIIDDGQADGTVSLAYDAGNNRAVAVWVHNSDAAKGAMNRTAWKLMYAIFDPTTGLWTPSADIPGTPSGGADQMPAVVTDGAGNALLVWARDDDGEFYTELSAVTNGTNVDAKNLDSHILWSKWSGTAWSAPQPVATGGEATRLSPSLAAAPGGKALAVWTEKEPGKLKSLRYAVVDLATGSWSAPELVTESGQFIEEPKAVVDATGKATVLWRGYAKGGKGGGALFSSTGQMPSPAWSEAQQVTQGDAIQWQPAAVLDQGNKLLTAWSEYNSATGAPVSGGGFAGGSGMNMADPDPGSAALTGSYSDRPVDADGDNLIDRLEVTVGVNILKGGDFEVRAELYKGTRLIAKAALVRNGLTAGNQTFVLPFSGAVIGDQGFDGPYLLKNVVVVDRNGTPVRTAFADAPYTTTGNYPATQFAQGPLALDRDHYTGTQGQAIITLTAPSLNTNADTIQTVAVRVATTRDPKGFPVTLTETRVDTGLFRGSVGFSLLASNPTLRQILVADHDLLQVVHDDPALDYRWIKTALWTIGGAGDVNGDGQVDMADAILALQVGAGNLPAGTVAMKEADVNGNGRIGAEEALYILQKAAGLR